MTEATARTLRTAERFLLLPPLPALAGSAAVHVCDISLGGVRIVSDKAFPTGTKVVLRAAATERVTPLAVECVVVWTQADSSTVGRHVSGIRALSGSEVMGALLRQLHATQRTTRIEELRAVDRFFVAPALEATFGGRPALLVDLSARGARIQLEAEPRRDEQADLVFTATSDANETAVSACVAWSALWSVAADGRRIWRAGLRIDGKADQLRLAIARLCGADRATLDTTSLHLKLRVMNARVRELASSSAGLPDRDPEKMLLVRGALEELRMNPEAALFWYRRARLVIADPATRDLAPQIADHPDALAVWEYLERSVDSSLIGRAFGLSSSEDQ